jgi:hypothetical protein
MGNLEQIIQAIVDRIDASGEWALTVEELEEYVDPVSLYRGVYERGLIGRDRYGPETVGELVGLLERVAGPDAEDRLRARGVFLNHDDRIELTERFVRGLRHLAAVHLPDEHAFRGMVRQTRDYERAAALYQETFLDPAPVVHSCAAAFAESAGGGEARRRTAGRYLRTLLERRVVSLPGLAPALFDYLRTIARHEGVLPPLSGREERGAAPEPETRSARDEACRLLGVRRGESDRGEIRKRYRALMRRYHPDVNPEGLDMAKRVNNAYALLMEEAPGGY